MSSSPFQKKDEIFDLVLGKAGADWSIPIRGKQRPNSNIKPGEDYNLDDANTTLVNWDGQQACKNKADSVKICPVHGCGKNMRAILVSGIPCYVCFEHRVVFPAQDNDPDFWSSAIDPPAYVSEPVKPEPSTPDMWTFPEEERQITIEELYRSVLNLFPKRG